MTRSFSVYRFAGSVRGVIAAWRMPARCRKPKGIERVRKVKTMAKTIVEIPDERLPELEAYKDKMGELLLLGLSQIKIQEALLLYQRGLVSFGRAAELAGLSEQEMLRQARAFGVHPRWAEKMIEEELVCLSLPTPDR